MNEKSLPHELELEILKIKENLNSKYDELYKEVLDEKHQNEKTLAILQEQLRSSENRLENIAVDKALRTYETFQKNIIIGVGLLTSFIAIAGWLGVTKLDNMVSTYVEEQTQKWLNFSGNDNPARDSLERMRNQTLLNYYVSRLSRLGNYSSLGISLTQQEKQRLMGFISAPDSTNEQFNDALNIIMATRKAIFFAHPDDLVGRQLTELIVSDETLSHRKIEILRAMQEDPNIVEISKGILENEQNSESIKSHAFSNIAMFDSDYAYSYGINNIHSIEDSYFRNEIFKFLAKRYPLSEELASYLDKNPKFNQDTFEIPIIHYMDVLDTLIVSSRNNPNADTVLAKEILKLVSLGWSFSVSDFHNSEIHSTLSPSDSSHTFSIKIHNILENTELLDEIAHHNPRNLEWLTRVTEAFQIQSAQHIYNAVTMKLGPNTKFKLADSTFLDRTRLSGKAHLSARKFEGAEALFVTWRDKVGIIKEAQITTATDFSDSSFSNSYNYSELVELTTERPQLN